MAGVEVGQEDTGGAAMSDRELLEMAAKAAGIEVVWTGWVTGHKAIRGAAFRLAGTHDYWNPLTDDGDALRLAVKLRIDLSLWINNNSVIAKTHIGAGRGISLHDANPRPKNDHVESFGDDPYAATRRAIVRAAAEIGRAQT
jgi:hypothetical protein